MEELKRFRQFLTEGSELGQKLAAVIRDDIGQGESIEYDSLLTKTAAAMESASDNAEAYDLLVDLANDIGKMTGDFGADSNYLDAANINLKDYGVNITEGNDSSSYKSKVNWYYIESDSDYPGPKNRTVPDDEEYDNHPGEFKGTELYIEKGTKGKVKGNKFIDEEGNDVEYIDKYFEKI